MQIFFNYALCSELFGRLLTLVIRREFFVTLILLILKRPLTKASFIWRKLALGRRGYSRTVNMINRKLARMER